MAGDTALVGAPHDEDPGGGAGSSKGAGSAYVYERADGSWRQQAKLAASDRDSEDAFGATLTIAGDRALVGAPFDEDPNGSPGTVRGGGSVYVFERANGSWDQVDKFAAEDGDSEDLFGGTIAYDGETALVGAPGDDSPNGKKAGSAYVFAPSDTGWQQRAKLAPNDGDADDAFGAVTRRYNCSRRCPRR